MLDALRAALTPKPNLSRRGFLRLVGVAGATAALAPFVPIPIAELPPPSTWTNFDALLKEYYADGAIKRIAYETATPFFAMIKKSERLP